MAATLNNITAPDGYDATSTLSCPAAARIRLQVNNQAIYWQRGLHPAGGGASYQDAEEFLLPGLYSFDEVCDAVRVRAAIRAADLPAGGVQAQVTINARTAEEVGLGG